MKGLLKNLGLILILVGAVILVACSFTGNVNPYQQKNCGLIPRKRNKKRRLQCNRLFLLSVPPGKQAV